MLLHLLNKTFCKILCKSYSLWGNLIILALLGISCERKESVSSSTLETSLVLENAMLNLGNVRLLDSTVATVTVQNKSSIPARFIGLQKSCACSHGEFFPTVIKPGEIGRGKFTVQVKTIGESRGWVKLEFSMDNRKIQKLVELKSNGIQQIQSLPASVDMSIDLRETSLPIYREGVVRLYSKNAAIKAMSCSISDAKCSFSANPKILDDASQEFAWTCSLTSLPPGGFISEQVCFVVNLDDKTTSCTVPLTGTVTGKLNVSRPILYMGIADPASTLRKELVIKSNDESPFTVDEVWSNMKCVEVTFDRNTRNTRHTIEVRVVPHDLPESGRVDGTLYLHTSLLGANMWQVPIKAFLQ
jgi:hypothetical protein